MPPNERDTMIDFPCHRRSSQNLHHECAEETYDMAVTWCRDKIHSCGGGRGDDEMLFSPRAFHNEIASASSKFGMPFEVRDGGEKNTCRSTDGWMDERASNDNMPSSFFFFFFVFS
jgi:hypothetical protein